MIKFSQYLILIAALISAACSFDSASRPILPVAVYEKMIVGNLDAEFIGTDNCVSKCHAHDALTSYFKKSVHGEQKNAGSNIPLVNCESCHGPGSVAVAHLDENIKEDSAIANRCDTSKLIDLKTLPAAAQSLICLKCHSAASSPYLSYWNTSPHALNDVSCSDCHKLHQDSRQKVSHEKMAELCFGCHPDVASQVSLFSHHPLREKKMYCSDCHDPHGSAQPKMLKGNSIKETCTRCHGDKRGPFVYEHGDVTDNCVNCHTPHGSVNRTLLSVSMPFLCIQCHNPGHTGVVTSTNSVKALFANRCTDCHAAIHGSDTPDNRGEGSLRR